MPTQRKFVVGSAEEPPRNSKITTTLIGSSADHSCYNRVNGSPGRDTLVGGDSIEGGTGNDTTLGYDTNDQISEVEYFL